MFGADAAQLSFNVTVPEKKPSVEADVCQYLLPSFIQKSPWQHGKGFTKDQHSACYEDCVMIAEFSEQEGPRPVVTIGYSLLY